VQDSVAFFESLPLPGNGPRLPGSRLVDFVKGEALWRKSTCFILSKDRQYSWTFATGTSAMNLQSYPPGVRPQISNSEATMRDALVYLNSSIPNTTDVTIGEGSFNRFLRLTPDQKKVVLEQAGFEGLDAGAINAEPDIGLRRTRDSKAISVTDPQVDSQILANWEEAWMTMWTAHAGLHPRIWACMQLYTSNGIKTLYVMRKYENFQAVIHRNQGDATWGAQNAGFVAALIYDMSAQGILCSDIKSNNMVYNASGTGDAADRRVMIIDLGADFTRWTTSTSVECVEMINTLLYLIGVWCKWGGAAGAVALVKPLVARLGVIAPRIMQQRSSRSNAYNLCVELKQILARDVNTTDRLDNSTSFYRDIDPAKLAEHILQMADNYGHFDPDGGSSKKCLQYDDLRGEFAPYINDGNKSALKLLVEIIQDRYGQYP